MYNMSLDLLKLLIITRLNFTICLHKTVSSHDYHTESNVTMIVEEAEKLYNKLVRDCITKLLQTMLLAHHHRHYHCYHHLMKDNKVI